jgi:hypothetical protein
LTVEQMRADLEAARRQLPVRHPNLFAAIPQAEFEEGVQRLDRDLPGLRPDQFYARLAGLIGLARDAHTSLTLAGPEAEALGFVPAGIAFRSFPEGLFVVAARDRQWHRGRVVAVGGQPIEEALPRLRALIPADNPFWHEARVPDYLRNLGVLRGLDLALANGPAVFRLRLEDGREIDAAAGPDAGPLPVAIGPDRGPVPAWLTRRGENYWSEYWPVTRTLYFQYGACSEQEGRPFARFASDTIALLDANPRRPAGDRPPREWRRQRESVGPAVRRDL